jgi:hypothetical protein
MIGFESKGRNGLDAGLRFLTNVGKQVTYATSQAVNATAKDVQTFTVTGLLPSAFTLRSKGQPWQKPGGKYGFNIRPYANKNTMTAILGSQADWLDDQEEGGTKTVAGHRVAIPVQGLKGKSEIISRNLKPRALIHDLKGAQREHARITSDLATARAREAQARNSSRKDVRALAKDARIRRKALEGQHRKSERNIKKLNTAIRNATSLLSALSQFSPFRYDGGKMKPGIYVRTSTKKGPIKIVYGFHDHASIKGILHFENKGAEMAAALFPHHFAAQFAKAVATAK